MNNKIKLFSELEKVVVELKLKNISPERKIILQPLINYIQTKSNNNQEINLNFICTHNSRRSHLSQIWSQTAAAFFGINNISCYSGGTETTQLFPIIANVLGDSGFQIDAISTGNNPIYSIKYNQNEHPIIGFSKTYDHAFNPKNNFAAIMTCSQADSGCPFVAGAEKRFSITFEDPKIYDNTPQQKQKYNEKSLQIATEMFYIFSKIKR